MLRKGNYEIKYQIDKTYWMDKMWQPENRILE